jgi:hypothetical protein
VRARGPYRRLAKKLPLAALHLLAAAYLVGIFVYGVGCTAQYRVMPGDVSNLLEVAALFPRASHEVTSYRIEGWACNDRLWEEVDYRAHFRLHAEDKENIFERTLGLYHGDTAVMDDLEEYVVRRHNARAVADGTATGQTIGGVRFVRIGIPIPKPGSELGPFRHKSLAAYPKRERHVVYTTPQADIDHRCGKGPAEETGARAALEPSVSSLLGDTPRPGATHAL